MPKIILVVFSLFFLSSCKNYQDFFSKFSFSSHSKEQNSRFIDGTDIPLFPDFTAVQNDEMSFDSSLGSISSFKYNSNAKVSEITDFYLKNMPQLGWKLAKMEEGKLDFVRQKENLVIDLKQNDDSGIEIKFLLSATI